MATLETFNAVVLGSGEAGKFMAWHLGKLGQRVAVVEGRYLGGSCPNIACLPSKNFIHSASVAHTVSTAAAFGGHCAEFAVSMRDVQARKRAMVEGLMAMHRTRFAAAGTELVWGEGRLVGERTVEVGTETGLRWLRGEKLFLDLGAFATVPDLPGLRDASAMTHVELLDIDTLPEHLLVLGGGYIAMELAQCMRRLGSKVTVVERAQRLLPREDPDISDAMAALMEQSDIAVITNAQVTHVSGRSGERVTLHGQADGGDLALHGTDLLVALGKAPNTTGIGLEAADIALTPAGYIQVNERLETTAPSVWAMGDCAGSPAFTHMSLEDFRIVRDNLDGATRSTVGRQVPFCMFTEPELARVGLNEMEAKQQGIAYRKAELPVAAILRTRTTGETWGKLKVLVATDDRILGFTAFAPRAGELLPPVQLAMSVGLSYRTIEQLVVAHPTYAEGLVGLFGAIPSLP